MENIKNTQNLETSALMMTQYERWGNIDTYSAYQARREIARDGEFLDWMYANAYKDENQEKRVAYALELVKAGY